MTYLETLKQSAEAIGLTLSDEALRRLKSIRMNSWRQIASLT